VNYLTSLRGIAALLVVLFHIRFYLADSTFARTLIPFLSHGYLAVDFFLVLSGFIMAYKYHEHFRGGVRTHSLDFLAKRIARIFPLHAFVMLAYIAIPVMLVATDREYDAAQFGIYEFVCKFLLIDLWTFDQVSWKSWNVPSWTISAEFFAYLLFPLLMFSFQRVGRYVVPTILMGACLLLALGYQARGCANLGECIGHLGLARCVIEFALGVGVYLARRDTSEISARAFAVGTTFAVAGYVALALSPIPNYWYVPVTFAALLYGLLGFSSVVHRVLETRPLVFLGDISYSVYLTHVLIAEVIFRMFVPPGETTASPWLVAGYVLAVLIFSTMTYRLVEKPARRRVYELLTGKRSATRTVAKSRSGVSE
jgi:peptidoglycan/LPS O-acetylase OafA/YrhL